ncbi:MAG TPA: hypothetical protein VII94_04435 [Candidatus Saccharimonadales bacterium]
MSESLSSFDHTICSGCPCLPHCGAGRMAVDFIKNTTEAELVTSFFKVNQLMIETRTAIIDGNFEAFQANREEIMNIMDNAYVKHQSNGRSFDQLLETAIRDQEKISGRDRLFEGDVSPVIDEARDDFLDCTSGSPVMVPTLGKILIAASDAIAFRKEGECLQIHHQN